MGDFNMSVWSMHCMLCVTMCNFIMYHTEIGICRKPKQIATRNAKEKRQI